jgi:hypothetical protein
MCEERVVVFGTVPPTVIPADVAELVGGGRRDGTAAVVPVPLEATFAGEDQTPADAVELVGGGGRRVGVVD